LSGIKNATEIAKMLVYLISLNDDGKIDNMILNKLLYYAQGHHMVKTGSPIFSDVIQAWEHGPVVPEVYHRFKGFGHHPIILTDIPDEVVFSTEEIESLLEVVHHHAGNSGIRLRNLTHLSGAPWSTVYAEGMSNEIPLQIIHEYFANHEAIATISDQLSKIPIELVTTDANGTWVIPKSEKDEYEA